MRIPILIFSSVLLLSFAAQAQKKSLKAFHDQTHWNLQSSLKYDFLCLLNTLSGDPYYLKYYEQEYQELTAAVPLTPDVQAALKRLKQVIKDENKGIVSAYLCLLYSASDANTLAQMRSVTSDSEQLLATYRESPYYSEKSWSTFERLRPDLLVILDFFIAHNFEQYYESTYAPRVSEKIMEISKTLPSYNIIPTIEDHVGFPLDSDTITVYFLYFSQPQGIKIIGTRYLTDVHWPFEIVFRNAVHEMMHPPFHPSFKSVDDLVEELQQDSLWSHAFEHSSTSSGYNTYKGLFEEGAVQALENHLNHTFGMGRNVDDYWQKQDNGLHIMAICLYVAMQDWDFSRRNHYTKFLRYFRKQVKKHGGLSYYYHQMYPVHLNE